MGYCDGMLVASLCLLISQTPAPHKALSRTDVQQMMKELSNWGRWGKDDQKGAINLITPERRKQSAKLVREGVSVSMARTLDMTQAPDNASPWVREMTSTGEKPTSGAGMDKLAVSYHGWAHTHMDSLSHIFFRGEMYNGYPQTEVTREGAKKLDVANFREGIVTRAVLFDIPRLKGVPYLEPGDAIYAQDLEAWLKKAGGLTLRSGDAILIRTGRWVRRAAKGAWNLGEGAPGLHVSVMPWIKKADAAILGSDATEDVIPSQVEGMFLPVHNVAIVGLGMPLLDNCDLDGVAEMAAKLKRWEFQIVIGPLPSPGGTGSPVNPIAVF